MGDANRAGARVTASSPGGLGAHLRVSEPGSSGPGSSGPWWVPRSAQLQLGDQSYVARGGEHNHKEGQEIIRKANRVPIDGTPGPKSHSTGTMPVPGDLC